MSIKTFKLERYFAEWEFTAAYMLSASDCETMSIGELLALTNTSLDILTGLRLGYTESQGDPAFRETIAGFYPGLTADNILVFNAPIEAIYITMMTLLEPGDKVVVQTPCYQSLSEVAAYRGAQVERWPMVETEAGWQMDLDHLTRLLTPDTKLLIINTPHNPTGYLPTLDEFELILNLAAERDIWLFSDEMYRGLEYDLAQRLLPAASRYERAISLWGMSKTFGLPGLRIGWLALQDADFLQQLTCYKDYTTICNSAPSELLSSVALAHADTIIERNLALIRQNLARLQTFRDDFPHLFAWREPLAGPITFVRLQHEEAAAFCDRIVRGCGALFVPSTMFEFGNRHVRIGLGRQNFEEGLAVLARFLRTQA